MATVLNKSTLELRKSVNTPRYDSAAWIINPSPAIINNVPKKYWKVVGDTIQEMSGAEKAAVDVVELDAAKKTKKISLRAELDDWHETKFKDSQQKRLLFMLHEAATSGLVNRVAYLQPYWDFVDDLSNRLHGRFNVVDAATTVEEVEAVGFNYVTLNGLVPNISVRNARAILD